MEKSFHSPAEIAGIWIENGVKKAKMPALKMILLAIFAGIFIGFGAMGFLVMTANLKGDLAVLGKLLGACLFPVGLMMVILCGAELFTGNNLLTLALFNKKISFLELLRNWVLVYLGNVIGSYLLAYFLYKSGLFSSEAMSANIIAITESKVSMGFTAALVRGILCNMLVVLACWFQAGSKDITGKILGIFFPIMLFVLSGYEHSVANMFYLPLGLLSGASVSHAAIWFSNILPVTLGNIIGGAIIVPVVYQISFIPKTKKTI